MLTVLLLTKLLFDLLKASCIECGTSCVDEIRWCDGTPQCPDYRDELYYCDVSLLVADSRILQVDPKVGGTGNRYIFNQSTSNPEYVRAVDYNIALGMMYYTANDGIYRANINGSGIPERVVQKSVYNPTGIAVDWVTGNIYWAEERLSSIFVMSRTGHRATVVGSGHTKNPYDLVLDVITGFIYWTDWASSEIKSATMSGENVLILNKDLVHPLGITLDQGNSVLYVTDSEAPGSIFQLNTDGSNYKVTYKAKVDDLNGFLCLTYYNGMLYMTDTTYHSGVYRLYSLSVTEPLSTPTVITEYRNMMLGVSALHYKLQPYRKNQCQSIGCQQLCLLSGQDTADCSCSDRLYLSSDKRTCVEEEHFLLFTDQLNVIDLNIDSRKERVLDFGDIKMQVGVGIDLDQTTGTVYWSDIRTKMIVKGSIDNTFKASIVTTNVQNPSGICVDWISKYVYWVDDGDNTLNIINSNGTMRKTLISKNLDKPRSIKVDPVNGYIFWSDRGTAPNIARANLDGTARVDIVVTDIILPNGIALDIPAKHVYWVDAQLDTIERVDYSGNNRTKILETKTSQQFSLSVLDQWIYYSDWQRKIIGRTSKTNTSLEETVFTSFGVVMEIHAYSTTPLPGIVNDCSTNNGGCSHFCFYSPTTAVTCACPDSITLNGDKKTCAESPCALNKGGCDQVCSIDRDATVQCSCYDFYEMVNGVCQDSYLLLATKSTLWKVSARGDSAYQKLDIPISGKVVAIDYDAKKGVVYWTDTLSDIIYKAKLNGNTSEPIVESGLQTPDGIAYDWVTDTIYWTDMSTHIIGVTTSDGRFQKKVLLFNIADKPRALVLDPVRGKLYFTDWGEHSGLYSANMDGSNKTVLVEDDVTWPNGLYLDRDRQVLYWVDAKIDKLFSVNVDGTNRTTLAYLSTTHSFALTKYKDQILWTDWRHKSINVVNISSPDTSSYYSNETQLFSKEQPFDIHWYSATYQQGSNVCGESSKGGCSHFCFYTPKGPVCGCPENIKLQGDNKTCIEDPCKKNNCQDKCLITESGGTKCVCNDWKKLDPSNGTSCIPAEDYLLVLERQDMLYISVDTDPTFKSSLPLTKILNGASLDIDYREGRVYWTDTLEDTISSAKLDGKEQRILIRGLQLPDGLAFDWVAKNIYWTDTGTDLIQVASSEGKHLHNLSISGLDRPRALTLSPHDRIFFWSDWGTVPIIAIANMDGSEQKTLVDTALGWPNGLAFDWQNKVLYWVDALQDMMESIRIDGTDRRVILDNQLQHPFGLTLYKDNLYWTDWTRQELLRANTDGSNMTVLLSRGSALMDLVMYAPDEQNPAPCYTEDHVVPDYDLLNGVMFLAVVGDRAEISLTHHHAGNDEVIQLILTTDSVHLVNMSSNSKIDVVDAPRILHQNYIRYFYISMGGKILTIGKGKDTSKNPIMTFTRKDQTHSIVKAVAASLPGSSTWICPSPVVSDCGVDNGGCYGLCLVRPGGRSCACDDYRLVDRHAIKCGKTPHILIADRYRLLLTEMLGNEVEQRTIVGESDLIVAVEYDLDNDKVYWSEPVEGTVKRADIDGKNVEVFLNLGTAMVEGLAIDWLHSLLYWVESHQTTRSISVATLDGKHRTVLVTEDLDKIRGLTIDPFNGFMYWCDWGKRPRVNAAWLDGTNVQQLETFDIHYPNSVTLDLEEQHLYYVDGATDVIGMIDVSKERFGKKIKYFDISGAHGFAINIYGGHLYMSDWISSSIRRINKYNGGESMTYISGLEKSNDIQILHQSKRPKGKHVRLCEKFSTTIICPLSGVIRKIKARAYSSPDPSVCSAITLPSIPCSEDVSDQLELCLSNMQCLVDMNNISSSCPTTLVMDLHYECSSGFTECDTDNGGCDQICVVPAGVAKCLCEPGYTLLEDKKTCQEEGWYVAAAVGGRVVEFSSASTTFRVLPVNPSGSGLFSIISLYSSTDSLVWWDKVNNNIYSTSLKGGQTNLKLLENVEVTAMDIEMTTGTIFCSSKENDSYVIKSLHAAGRLVKLLVTRMKRIDVLKVYQKKGYLFWVEDSRLLMRSDMIGTAPTKIFSASDHTITDFTVDHKEAKLYIGQSNSNRIKIIDFTGGAQAGEMTPKIGSIQHLAVFNNFLVAIDNSSIWKITKVGENLEKLGTLNNSSDVAYHSNTTVITPCSKLSCQYFCFVLRDGEAQCFCPDGYHMNTTSQMCDGLCLENNGGCQDYCTVRDSTVVQCTCNVGYHLASDGKNCIESKSFLLAARTGGVYRYLLDQPEDIIHPPILPGVFYFDYDWTNQHMIWYDEEKKSIMKGNYSTPRVLHKDDKMTMHSLAFDWISGNIYWIDNGRSIKVVRSDGGMSLTILGRGLHRASDLQLHPAKGQMYFVTFGEAETFEIQRCNLDGSGRAIVYELEAQPGGLALDTKNDLLYYTLMGKQKIKRIDLSSPSLPPKDVMINTNSPLNITAFDKHMIWVESNGVIWSAGETGAVEALARGLGDVYLLRAYKADIFTGVNPCQEDNGGCSELCFAVPGTTPHLERQCACREDIILAKDGTTCGLNPILLVSATTEIYSVNIATGISEVTISNLSQAVIVDYDLQEQKIYWTDVKVDKIMRADFTGDNQEVIVDYGLVTPDGMAVDWINRNIYWSDSHTSRFEVSRLDGRYRRSLTVERLSKPRGICIDPIHSQIFWADWGTTPFIAKMDTDGTNLKVLAQRGLAWPNSLSINLETEQIMWVDASRDWIGIMNLDGTNMKIVSEGEVSHPFSIDHYMGVIYWSDWYKKSVIEWEYGKENQESSVFLTTNGTLHHGIKVMHKTKQPTTQSLITPCTNDYGGCEQLCFAKPALEEGKEKRRVCGCQSDMKLSNDGVSCEDPASRLIVARGYEILHVLLNNGTAESINVLPVGNITAIIAFDFDISTKTIFFGDTYHEVLASVKLDGTNLKILIDSDIGSPDGIAYDWISGNIYWTDTGYNKIEVCSRDGTTRKAIIVDRIEEPRALALDPMKGHMYWTDWGSVPKIEVSDMTGENRKTLISKDVGWPNGLVLDLVNRVMYWTDAKQDWIGKADLDGSNNKRIITTRVHQPFSITIAGDYLLWSDWYLNSIDMALRSNYSSRSTILERYTNLMTLHYYDGSLQHKESNGCEVGGHSCSHLCLYTPSGPKCACKSHIELKIDGKTCKSDPCENDNGGCSDICSLSNSGVVCMCPEMSLLMNDGKTCIGSSQSLLIAAQTQIYRVTLDTPTPQVTPLTLRTNFCLALTYDRTTKRVIFRDGKWGILSALIDGSDLQQLNDDTDAFAMTVDSFAGNLYWVQKNMVKVSKSDGSHIKTLFQGNSSITDIIVYPQKHLLLWSSKNGDKGQIHSAGLDGAEPVVIDNSLVNPISLSIDFKTNLLYAVDESRSRAKSVYRMSLDGSMKTNLYTTDVYTFIDIAVEDNTLYWTQQPPNVLYSAKLPNGIGDAKLLLSHIPAFDVVLVNGTIPEGVTGCEGSPCEGLCFAAPEGYECACEDGVPVSETNKSRCGKEAELLVVKHNTIMSYNLITGTTEVVIDGLQYASAVSYHHKKQILVWADAVNDKIFSVRFQDRENRSLINTVVGYGVESIVSIEVDWVTDKVYWIDSGTDTLGVIQLDGQYQIILSVTNISEPSALALFPEEGVMFFADNTLKKIYRLQMDGTEQSTLFESSETIAYSSVKALVVDQEHHKLYWTDIGEDYAASCNLDGSEVKKLMALKTSYATSIALYNKVLYYSEMVLNETIYGYNIDTEETSVLFRQTAQDILVKHISLQRPVKSQCSVDNGRCDHLCLLAGTSYTCACANGLVKSTTNIYKCVEPETSIIVAGRARLLKISLDTTPATISVLPLSLHTVSAIALTVDILNEIYFWTDVSKDAIFKGYWNSSGWYEEIIVDTNVKTPDGMVFDWISQILYWTDTAMTHIQVCKPDGSSRRTLITGLSKPRALAVDPNNGHIYWSEWGSTPRIARALTDGTMMETIVDDEIGWPNGMALHHNDRILYWADARMDKITGYNLNTGVRTVLASSEMHPFGMAVWGEYVYWTDWQHLAVERVNRHTGGNVETVISGWKDLMGIAIFHKEAQPVISQSDCIYGNGDYFRGTISQTITGRTCQKWNVQEPHQHSRTLNNYPLSGVGDHNYCRNPDDEPFPWCYTTDPDIRWEYCSIKRCGVKRFESFSTPKTFFDAQAYCKNKNGELATIRDSTENTKLRFMLKIDRRGAAWIGLINLHGDNTLPYTWNSGDATEYLNWADAEKYGDGYAVAMMVKNGTWVTYNKNTTLPFACQMYSQPEGYTIGGTADGAMCSFPFYKNKALQYTCTPVDGTGRETCGTVKTTKPLNVGYCLTKESEDQLIKGTATLDGRDVSSVLSSDVSNCETGNTLHIQRQLVYPIQQVSITLKSGLVHYMTVNSTNCTSVLLKDTLVIITCQRPVMSDTLTVYGSDAKLCSVTIHPLENLALNQSAILSNPYTDGSGSAMLAVDGIFTGRSKEKCSSSIPPSMRRRRQLDLPDHAAMWQLGPQFLRVDLGSVRNVGQIVLYLYTNINPFEVHVGNISDKKWDANPACGMWQYSSSSDLVKRVNCGAKGRYVTIVTRDETKPITLCEIEVLESAEPTYGGNSTGAPCMHPFVYKGDVYHDGCALSEKTWDPWCYTVPKEEDQTWGYCQHATEVNSCAFSNGQCSDLCFNTPEGVRCACSDFIKLTKDGKTCEVSKCAQNNGGCKESCKLDVNGDVSCGCKAWYKLNKDKVSCSRSEHFLLGANKTAIFNISLDTEQGSMEVLFDGEMANSIGIAYSQANKRVFWTDATHDAIYSANFDGSDRKIIVSEGVFTPDCLAYDWTSELIYWSDAGADKIELVRSDGQYRNTIASGIEAPRGVALHSQKGLMFWTDWGQKPAIEMATMNGLNRKKIITSNIAWPNGITIDYAANRIIWVDAKIDVVESADLDGSNRRIIQDKDIVHPFGATIFGSEILWTDWGRRSVEAANKDGTGRRTVYQGIRNPMNILAIQDQTAKSFCHSKPCNEGICIPTSNTTRVCMCERYVDLQNDKCEHDPLLYLGMIDKLSYINIKSLKDPIVVSNKMVSCIDFDQKEKKLYHGGYTKLWRSNLDGSEPEVVMNTGLADLTDIAVDWIGRNVYYIDSYLGILGVVRMDGKYRASLLSDLKQPNSVAVAMTEREVFYTIWYHGDHANAGIWKVNMDGTGAPVQVHKFEVSGKYPWTLVVDHVANKLWWSNSGDEQNDYICSSNLDGSYLITHKKGVNLFVNFLAVHEDNVYYIDGNKHVIAAFNKQSGKDISFRVNIQSYEYELSSISLVHPSQQPWVYSRCHEDNGGCEQLCLLNPSGDTYTCMCGAGYSRFMIHNKNCARSTEFIILATFSGLFELNLNLGSVPRRLPVSLPYNITGLHVNPVNKEIIWLEIYLKRIVKGTLFGSETQVLINRKLQNARALHVDFVSSLMFWINGADLEMANTSGGNRKTILKGVMANVNEITADPTLGILYWVEVKNGGLKRASSEVRIKHALYTGEIQDDILLSTTSTPTYLTVNTAKDILIWIDNTQNTIQYIYLNETQPSIQTIVSPYSKLGSLIQLTMLHESIYYRVQNHSTYEDESKLFKTSLLDFSKHAVIATTLPRSLTLDAFDAKQTYWKGERKLIKSNDTLVNRAQAAEACVKFNGTLAIINNADENDEVLAQLYQDKEMWIGASDPTETEDWLWPDGTRITYSNWRDRPFRINGSFVTINKDGAWVSRGAPDNPSDKFGFICQVIYKSNKCITKNGGCSHICLTSINKPVCACPDNIDLLPDGKTCEESSCNKANCTDQCTVTKTGPICTCPAGMVMVNSVCEMTDSWVIIVTDSKIVRQSVNSEVILAQTIAMSHIRKTESAAVDVENDRIYFTDKHSNQIFSKKSQEREFLLYTEKRGQIIDISYDWIEKNVVYSYYDSSYNSYIVTRKVTNPDISRVIKTERGSNNKVMSIWCYSTYGYIFYTTQSGAVKRVRVDGTETKLIYQGDSDSILGVKADIMTSKLYISTNLSLYSMGLAGGNVRAVLGLDGPIYRGDNVWPSPFAVHDDRIYWAKQAKDGWIVATKTLSSDYVTYLYHAHMEYANADLYEQILGIHLMNKQIQAGERRNNTILDCTLPENLDNDLCNETGKNTQDGNSSIIAIIVSLLLAIVLFVLAVFLIRRYRERQVRYDRMEDPAFDIMTYDNPLYDGAEEDNPVSMPVLTLTNQNIEHYDIGFNDTPDDEDLLLTEHEVFDRI